MSAEHTAAFKHLPNTKNKSHLMRLTMNCIRGLNGFPHVTTIFPNTIPIVYTSTVNPSSHRFAAISLIEHSRMV